MLLGMAAPARAQQVLHRVRINETLASIAEDYYGTKVPTPILAQVNGLEPKAKLEVASRLRVPTAWLYRVPRTTSLRALAKRLLGDPRRYVALQTFNRALRHRMRVKAGTQLLVPFTLSHTVSSKDTFIGLARRYYGVGKRAKLIAQYNFLKGTQAAGGSTLLIPMADVRITSERLQELTNKRVLGIASGQDRERQALIEANASLRQGRYWYVPLALLRMLARQVPAEGHVVDVFKLLAIAYVALEQRDLAVLAFKEALLRQPSLQLSPMNTSPKVIKAFHAAQSSTTKASGGQRGN